MPIAIRSLCLDVAWLSGRGAAARCLSSRGCIALLAAVVLGARVAVSECSILQPPATPKPGPDRPAGEGEGQFTRLIIRGATVIDGTGAPPRGPMDLVIEGNRLVEVRSVGSPRVPIDSNQRPRNATREIDATGKYVLPGFVDLHVHTTYDVSKAPEAEYYYKLWLAHGITAVRGVPFSTTDWSLREKARSARNEITAPRLFVYQIPGTDWSKGPIRSPDDARAWVRWAAERGVDGLKSFGDRPEIMAALLSEAKRLGLGSVAHLGQMTVAQMNAMDAARLGLGAVTHFYGLFESLYESSDIQPWPAEVNYNDEQHRFSQVARQWSLVHARGSEAWTAVLRELRQLNLILDPTMTAYLAGRDLIHRMGAPWHVKYTLPSLWDFYQPSRSHHGSYYYNLTTWDEIAWRNFLRVWMTFLNDYKNMGGRVTVSSDAGFMFNTPGFATIEEMELLQEAGFHPLEVIRGATMHGAEALFEPAHRAIEFGVIREGLLADLVVVSQNPIANLKVLYGTGWLRLDDDTGKPEWVGGVEYTVKDGIVYDAKKLLADVAAMVVAQKHQRASAGRSEP